MTCFERVKKTLEVVPKSETQEARLSFRVSIFAKLANIDALDAGGRQERAAATGAARFPADFFKFSILFCEPQRVGSLSCWKREQS